jgi:hypothetical protein
MQMKTALTLAIGAFVVVVVLAGLLIALPAPETAQSSLSDRVIVTTPPRDATVEGTFTVTGSAPGPWYFEASFPVRVLNEDNVVVAETYAQAQGEWMTEDLVPFVSTVTVKDYVGPATLVLLRDNPSGLPENDDSVSLPIIVQ